MKRAITGLLILLAIVATTVPALAGDFTGYGTASEGGTIDVNVGSAGVDARLGVEPKPPTQPVSHNTAAPTSEENTPPRPTDGPNPTDGYVIDPAHPWKGFKIGMNEDIEVPIPPTEIPDISGGSWEEGTGMRKTILHWNWTGYNIDTGRAVEERNTPAAQNPETTYTFTEAGKYQITARAWTRFQPLKCIKTATPVYDDKGTPIGFDVSEEWVPDGPPYEDWGRQVVYMVTVTVDDVGRPIKVPSDEVDLSAKVVKVDETTK